MVTTNGYHGYYSAAHLILYVKLGIVGGMVSHIHDQILQLSCKVADVTAQSACNVHKDGCIGLAYRGVQIRPTSANLERLGYIRKQSARGYLYWDFHDV